MSVRVILTFVVLLVFGMVGCQSGNDLGVQLMSGDGQDLGRFNKGEKIVIPGVISNATDSTRLLYGINMSPLRMVVNPDGKGNKTMSDFTIEIEDKDVFLKDGTNQLVLMRLDGKQQAEHSLSFELR